VTVEDADEVDRPTDLQPPANIKTAAEKRRAKMMVSERMVVILCRSA